MRRTGQPAHQLDEAGEPFGLTYSSNVQPRQDPHLATPGPGRGYDTAERATGAATNQDPTRDRYVYDEVGRQTTLPAVDTPDEAKGDM